MSSNISKTKPTTSAAAGCGGRVVWLDAARTAAILGVLLCHSIETAYDLSLLEWRDAGVISKIFRLCGFSFGRLGVPLFLFLTGFLILSKDFSEGGSIRSFWKRRLPPMVCATLLWNVIYFFFLCSYNGEAPDWRAFWRMLVFLGQAPFSHMWYMPMIIGMYIALPLVARAIRGLTARDLALPMTVCYITGFILPFVNLIIKMNGEKVPLVGTTLNVAFLGSMYGFYIVLGRLCATVDLRKVPTWWFAASAAVSFAVVCVFQTSAWAEKYNYGLWYDFPLLPVCAVSLFVLLERIFGEGTEAAKRSGKALRFFAGNAFAVFFLHRPIQLLLLLPVENLGLKKPYVAGFILLFSAAVSFGLAALLRKSGFIKKWVLGGN